MKRITITWAIATILFVSSSQAQNSNQSENNNYGLWDLLGEYFRSHAQDHNPNRNNGEDYIRIHNLEGMWKFQIGDNPEWASPHYQDDRWERVYAPADWENEGFHGYDGFAWYRIHFDGTKLNPNQNHYILLGAIDDVDETFVNGSLVGRTGSFPPRFRTAYNVERKYQINRDLINFEGDNVIAVKVYDEFQNGGIVNGQLGLCVSATSQFFLQDLSGPWKFSTRNLRSHAEREANDSRWDEIIVPDYWDNQGYRSFDGTAWYRKSFSLNFVPNSEENYYLILGKIDDFDVTYFNGEVIGETRDYGRLGESQSYSKIRIYKIPNQLLTQHNEHVIAIKVHDLGLEGGIYSNGVGIVTESEITRMMRR